MTKRNRLLIYLHHMLWICKHFAMGSLTKGTRYTDFLLQERRLCMPFARHSPVGEELRFTTTPGPLCQGRKYASACSSCLSHNEFAVQLTLYQSMPEVLGEGFQGDHSEEQHTASLTHKEHLSKSKTNQDINTSFSHHSLLSFSEWHFSCSGKWKQSWLFLGKQLFSGLPITHDLIGVSFCVCGCVCVL